MTFTIATIVHYYKDFPESFLDDFPLLNLPQWFTLALDTLAVVGMVFLAVWMLSNHSVHPLGSSLFNAAYIPYILLGSAGLVAGLDMISFAIQTAKKINLHHALRQHMIDNAYEPDPTDLLCQKRSILNAGKKKAFHPLPP